MKTPIEEAYEVSSLSHVLYDGPTLKRILMQLMVYAIRQRRVLQAWAQTQAYSSMFGPLPAAQEDIAECWRGVIGARDKLLADADGEVDIMYVACRKGHQFMAFTDHPRREGGFQCPYCMDLEIPHEISKDWVKREERKYNQSGATTAEYLGLTILLLPFLVLILYLPLRFYTTIDECGWKGLFIECRIIACQKPKVLPKAVFKSSTKYM